MKKIKFTSYYLLLLACIMSLLLSTGAAAQQTQKISFQGFLKDENGKAVKNDTMTFFFKLFPTKTGGTAEWTEKQTLRVTDGIYSVKIGTGTNLVSGGIQKFSNLNWETKQYFVEVTVRNTTLENRTELTYAPYALGVPKATVADTAYALKNSIIDFAKKIALSSTATSFADFSNGFQVTNSNTQRFTVTTDGKVGIGTTTPTLDLSINHSDTGIEESAFISDIRFKNKTQLKIGTYIQIPKLLEVNTSGNKLSIASDTTAPFETTMIENGFYTQGNDGNFGTRFFIKTNDEYIVSIRKGNLGIGIRYGEAETTLHVKGTQISKTGLSTSRYFYSETENSEFIGPKINFLTPTDKADKMVALFEGDVVSSAAFIATKQTLWSDTRLKESMQISDSKSDLATLAKIEVTDYKYIDTLMNGNNVHKKVIAQQLESVYPKAVSQKHQVLPSVYQLASNFVFNAGKLTVTTQKAHGFVKDDDIMLKTPSSSLDRVKVLEVIDAHTFCVETTEKPEQLFVYGKYADDVLAVDYDAISMLNISATQELARRVKALEQAAKQPSREATNLDARLSKIEALLQLNTSTNKK